MAQITLMQLGSTVLVAPFLIAALFFHGGAFRFFYSWSYQNILPTKNTISADVTFRCCANASVIAAELVLVGAWGTVQRLFSCTNQVKASTARGYLHVLSMIGRICPEGYEMCP
jgi:hypothetical protein